MSKFGLIGKTLGHSFSQPYFTEKFRYLELDHNYDNFECSTIGEVKELLKNTDVIGFNVTAPFKESIIPLLDKVDGIAKEIGAVNTICKQGHQWIGYNTDVFGFKQLIKPFFASHHERAMILGSGGASKAVKYVLEELGCSVIYVSRHKRQDDYFLYSEVNEQMLRSCPVIVNTTPVGSYPNVNEVIDFPFQFLNSKNLVIDLVYNPPQTTLLLKAKEQGALVVNGLTMLHQQAEKSWGIWQANHKSAMTQN